MIISDKHRFAFIHIPKCAGTTVRKQLQSFDSYDRLFDKFGDHPVLGRIAHQHLPLSVLRQHFPDAYEKVRTYESFVILRNPLDRFLSSIRQRVNEFGRVPNLAITDKLMMQEAHQVLEYLAAGKDSLKLEYVHFLRQSDFIFDRDIQIVRNVCTLLDTSKLESFVRANIKRDFRMSLEENFSKRVRSPLVERAMSAWVPQLAPLLSLRTRERVWEIMLNLGVAEKTKLRYRDMFDVKTLEKIYEYYAADIALYERLSASQVAYWR